MHIFHQLFTEVGSDVITYAFPLSIEAILKLTSSCDPFILEFIDECVVLMFFNDEVSAITDLIN